MLGLHALVRQSIFEVGLSVGRLSGTQNDFTSTLNTIIGEMLLLKPMVPLISVITPVYNSQDVLPYAIESVLRQTHEHLELIIVDDASTDGSAWIAEHYARKDSRITVLHNPRNSRNGPIEWEPRNDGLRVATGTFIAYLDADNEWRPTFLAVLATVLLADPHLQLAHCNSCNYYSAAEKKRTVAIDGRSLQSEGEQWTVFSNGLLDVGALGSTQYVDTNEMVHRSSIFEALNGLWNTRHPRRDLINRHQGHIRPMRRHNDLDLFERVVANYGQSAVQQIDDVLVDFYYPSFPRPLHPLRLSVPSRRRSSLDTWLALPAVKEISDKSPGAISAPIRGGSVLPLIDLGVGEVSGVDSSALREIWDRFTQHNHVLSSLAKYPATLSHSGLNAFVATQVNTHLAKDLFDHESVIVCNGATDALQHAIAISANPLGSGLQRSGVAFAVPGYSYWNIVNVLSRRSVPIECYNAEDFIRNLRSLKGESVGAVIVSWPHNPLGYVFSRDEIASLSALARSHNWKIVVDLAYESFLSLDDNSLALAGLDKENTIFCSTVSKSWGLPGLRLGFAITADHETAAIIRSRKLSQTMMPSGLTQLMGSFVMQYYGDLPAALATVVRHRRLRLRSALESYCDRSLRVSLPSQLRGLFEIIDMTQFCEHQKTNCTEVSERLFKEYGLRVRSAISFFPPEMNLRINFLRLSVGVSDEVEDGAMRIAQFLRTYPNLPKLED